MLKSPLTGFDISCKMSLEAVKACFMGKIKNIISLSSAEFAERVLIYIKMSYATIITLNIGTGSPLRTV